MQTRTAPSEAACRDDLTRIADPGYFPAEARLTAPQISDDQIMGVLCDLFAGRTQHAFGESLEWWAETFQCDLGPKTASGVVLAALSKWPFDQRAGAPGVKALQEQLLQRARMLIDRFAAAHGEAA